MAEGSGAGGSGAEQGAEPTQGAPAKHLEKVHKDVEKLQKDFKPEIKEGKIEIKEGKPEKEKPEIKEGKPEGKEVKPEKEKIEIKEGKPEKEKIEIKEHKPEKEKIEIKEHKLEKHEIKEFKVELEKHPKIEIKEIEKQIPDKLPGKEFVEGPQGPGGDPGPFGGASREALEAHASALEQAAQEVRHFIEQSDRPATAEGALQNEPDQKAGG